MSGDSQKKKPKKKKYHYIGKPKNMEPDNPDNPMNIGDPEVFKQELELMKGTHKILMSRVDAGVRRKKNPDIKP